MTRARARIIEQTARVLTCCALVTAVLTDFAPGRAFAGRSAPSDPSVTLTATPTAVSPGETVTLSGEVSPPAAGETVTITDQHGTSVAQPITDADGSFSATITPEETVTLTATWQGVSSPPVTVVVGTVEIEVHLTGVRLFGSAVIRGKASTPAPDVPVTVSLLRSGSVADSTTVATDESGAFRARFSIDRPGTYRARASLAGDDQPDARAISDPRTTPLPSLGLGSHSVLVGLLEKRLVFLNYRLIRVNNVFDGATGDAVLAFTKVQRMTRISSVDAAIWRALADPIRPRPRSAARAFHIEVDQSRQVLYTVGSGKITNIIHVSTGAGGATHDGSFHVYRKLAGFSGNHLYYPNYFDGLRAIHGWTDVPSYPASHGCVRVPYWNALWIFSLAKIGTPVVVYH